MKCPWCGAPWTTACTRNCAQFYRFVHLPPGEAQRRIRAAQVDGLEDTYDVTTGVCVLGERSDVEADDPYAASLTVEPLPEPERFTATVCAHAVWNRPAEFCTDCLVSRHTDVKWATGWRAVIEACIGTATPLAKPAVTGKGEAA